MSGAESVLRTTWIGCRALATGAGAPWLLSTTGFEFGFGRIARGKRRDGLLAAYAFQDGNLWPLVLVATVIAPLVFGRRGLPGA